MNFPRPYTPINYDIEFDKDDEIGRQPNKRPIKTIETKDEKIITNSVKLKPKAINNNDFDDTL